MSHSPPQHSYGDALPVPGSPSPAKRRRVWPWVAGGVAALMILGCVGTMTLFAGGAKVASDAINEVDQNAKGRNAVAGELGEPVKDGKFEFTVTKMKCGVEKVGGEFGNARAQGEYCLVDVTVRNVGKSAEMFDSGSQKAYDATGTEYSVDTTAETYVNDQSQTFLENINPGNKVHGRLVFDVPEGTRLDSIVVHESTFTAGVRVPLR